MVVRAKVREEDEMGISSSWKILVVIIVIIINASHSFYTIYQIPGIISSNPNLLSSETPIIPSLS